jgi:hypothetical protein
MIIGTSGLILIIKTSLLLHFLFWLGTPQVIMLSKHICNKYIMSLKQLIKDAVATDLKKVADTGRLPVNPLARIAAQASKNIASLKKPGPTKS